MNPLFRLTEREQEVARLIAVECLTSKEAARSLGISFRTVETHRAEIFRRLNVRNVAALARFIALADSAITSSGVPRFALSSGS